jgi:hypothetical protein
MPDRKSVSMPGESETGSATSSWKGIFDKSADMTNDAIEKKSTEGLEGSSIVRFKFDDATLPPDKRKTPEFLYDDCVLHPETRRDFKGNPVASDHLNYAYRGKNSDITEQTRIMNSAHQEFLKYHADVGSDVLDKFLKLLEDDEILQEYFNELRGA